MNSNWELTTLGDVTEWMSGGTPKKDEPAYWGGSIPWISANSMSGSRYEKSELRLTELGLRNGSRLAPKESILLLVRGGALHSRIPVGLATCDLAFNQDVKALIADKNKITPLYLLYWLMGNERYLLDSVVEYTGIGAGKLDTKRLQSLGLLLPPLEEQDRITQMVGSIDDRITLLRETNATLEAIAQGLFKSWFVDFDPVRAKQEGRTLEGMDEETAALFPDSFEESEFGMIPRGWCAANMSYLIALHKGTVTPKNHPNEVFQHFSLPAYDAGNMPMDEKGSAIQSNKTTVPEDAVLISKLNPHIPRIWLPAVVEKNAVCSTEFLPFVPTQDNRPAFVYCLLSTPELHASICQLATGTSNSHQRIKPDGILSLPATVPPVGVISKFNDVASPLLDRVKENRLIIQSLSSLRDTLLPRLINGQIRLRDSVVSK